ncbi:hypothetical protein M426DRAFT_257512 [Hypoxylon sp. CI-4A]|nr:hypothetical protein M426DRAFT_257512 [Hypoxylon sp. CI-4A]
MGLRVAMRGTSNTPLFSCWPDDTTGYYALLGDKLASSSDTAVGQLWAEGEIIAGECYTQLTDIGDKVGMVFAARDMMSIVDALDEDGMLRYWGISGGTALGATGAAMFPDRVESVVLDGVQPTASGKNSYAAASPTPETAQWHTTPLFAELLEATNQYLSTIRCNPPVYNETYVIDYSTVKTYIYNNLYSPSAYPSFAQPRDDAMSGNCITAMFESLTNPIPSQAQAILGSRVLTHDAHGKSNCTDAAT